MTATRTELSVTMFRFRCKLEAGFRHRATSTAGVISRRCYIGYAQLEWLSYRVVKKPWEYYVQPFWHNTSQRQQNGLLPHFASPGYAPATIAINVIKLEREFNACKTPHCIYPSVFNHFWDRAIYGGKWLIFNVRQSYCARYYSYLSVTRLLLCRNGSTYRQTVFTAW